jgi:hypothetical protein
MTPNPKNPPPIPPKPDDKPSHPPRNQEIRRDVLERNKPGNTPEPEIPPSLPPRPGKPLPPPRNQEIRRNLIQRFKHGSSDTNTLNLPPPPPACYVDHLLIRETWGENKADAPENQKKHRDPMVIAKEIEKNQKELENAYYMLDNLAMSEKPNAEAEREKLNKHVLAIQDRHIRLDMERIRSQASLAPYEPPKGVREFVIVEFVPPRIQDEIDLAESRLKPLRENLSTTLEDWYKAHTDHEVVKKELMEFAKKKNGKRQGTDNGRFKKSRIN